jgi:hypothetical protein
MQSCTSQLRKRIEQAGNLAVLTRALKRTAGGSREFVVMDEEEERAPIERCFALSTHLAVVEMTLAMQPVSGRMKEQLGGAAYPRADSRRARSD